LLGKGLRPRIGDSPSKSKLEADQLARYPWTSLKVKSKNSTSSAIFRWLITQEEAFIGLSKSAAEPDMNPKLQTRITKSREQALAAFVATKAEIDTMLTRLQELSDNHFNYSPDEISWAHVGTLENYAELLKRITDSAFDEGEHAE
jgi:hypothetical protein